MKTLITFFISFCLISAGLAQSKLSKDDKSVLAGLDEKQEQYAEVAHQIWNYAELGYQEEQSSQLLQKTLSDAGFSVEAGVADIPTAFVASYGSGEPVIALLAEFDALPGMSQTALMLATTRHEKPFLWPATIPDPNGREMACHRSMLEAQTTAIHQWTQVCWNAPKSDYDVDTATADLGEPKWPTESFRDLLELCFRGRLLNDMDHPFIQQLLGKI